MIYAPDLHASFSTLANACRLADESGEPVRCVVEAWKRGFEVKPGENPHTLYRDIFPE